MVKVTIDQGSKVVGKRVTIPLRTSDPEIAMGRRDAVIETCKALEALCRDVTVSNSEM